MDIFEKYKKSAFQLNIAANSLWNKITFISVSEVINNEVEIRELDKICWNIKDKVSTVIRSLSNEMNQLPEDEYFDNYEDTHTEIEDLFYKIDKKLDAIDVIVSALKEVQEKSDEDNFNDYFKDIHKINIDESYSFIRLNRFKR